MKNLLVLVLLFPLVSAAQIKSLSCSSTSITGAASDVCTVALSSPAGSNGLTVSLNSSNPAVTLPGHIWVGPKATSLSFTATVAAVANAQTAILTAFYNYAGVNSPQTVSLNLYPARRFGIHFIGHTFQLIFRQCDAEHRVHLICDIEKYRELACYWDCWGYRSWLLDVATTRHAVSWPVINSGSSIRSFLGGRSHRQPDDPNQR